MFMDLAGMSTWLQGIEIELGDLPWRTASLHHRIFSLIHWPVLFEVCGLGLFPSLVWLLLQHFGGLFFNVSFCWFQDILGEGDSYPVASFCFCNLGGHTLSFLSWFPLNIIFLLPNSFPYSSSVFFMVSLPIPIKLKHFQSSLCTLLFQSLHFHSPPM